MDDPDGELVLRAGQGDADAIAALVRRKLHRLLALAQRVLGDRAAAEDVAQETFVRIWKQAPRWKPGEAMFDTWMHRVALNLCYDRLRRRREVALPEDWDATDPDPSADTRIEAAERDAAVERALQAIAPRQREAIVLTYYQEMSNIAAAEAMGVQVDALESLLARGRRALRARLIEPDHPWEACDDA